MSGALDAIRSRAEAYSTHGTPGLAAPSDRRDLLAVLDEVVSMCDQALSISLQGSSDSDAAVAGFAAAMKRKLETK